MCGVMLPATFLASSNAELGIQRSLCTANRHGSTAKTGSLEALKISLNKEGNDSKFKLLKKTAAR